MMVICNCNRYGCAELSNLIRIKFKSVKLNKCACYHVVPLHVKRTALAELIFDEFNWF